VVANDGVIYHHCEKSDGSKAHWGVSDNIADQVLKLIAGDTVGKPLRSRKNSRANEASWKKRGPKRQVPFTQAQLDKALEMRSEGVPVDAIARAVAATPRTLRRDFIRYDTDRASMLTTLTPTEEAPTEEVE
jgi:hypothetical protein